MCLIGTFYIFCVSEPATKDWMIVELQGVLESNQTGGYNGLPIGDLHFDDQVNR